MKKTVLIAALSVLGFTGAKAQENTGQTAKGKWLIEANTGFGGAHYADTSIRYSSQGDASQLGVGLEGGYFVMDNLAIKAGLGYTSIDDGFSDASAFSYKVGVKYYIIGNVPVQIDYSAASIKDYDENPSYLGLQAGYAIFLGQHVSVEPGVKYNLSMNEDYTDEGLFQLNIGFALHF